MMKLALLCLATSVLSEPPPLLHRPPEAEFDAITIDLKVRRKEAGPLLDHLAAAHNHQPSCQRQRQRLPGHL